MSQAPEALASPRPQESIEFDLSHAAPPLTLQENTLARDKARGDHDPLVAMPHAPSKARLRAGDLFWLVVTALAFGVTLVLASLAVGSFFATTTEEASSRILYVVGILSAAFLLPFLISMSNRERFRVTTSLLFRLRKTFIGAALLNLVLIAAVVASGPKELVHFLESNPAWFSDRVEGVPQEGLHATNRLVALKMAAGLRRLIGQDVAEDTAAVPSPRPTRDHDGDTQDALPPIKMAPGTVNRRKLHPGLEKMLKSVQDKAQAPRPPPPLKTPPPRAATSGGRKNRSAVTHKGGGRFSFRRKTARRLCASRGAETP